MKKFIFLLCGAALVTAAAATLVGNKRRMVRDLDESTKYSVAVPIEVAMPRRALPKKIVEETGSVKAEAEVSVISETSGKALMVLSQVGDRVMAGQLLARVEKDVVESQFSLAQATLDNAEKDLSRTTALLGGDAITRQQFEAVTVAYQSARAAYASLKKQLENTSIKSSVDGVVASRSIDKGAWVQPGMALFTIVEDSRLIMVLKMTDGDIAMVRKGRKVMNFFPAQPDFPVAGFVRTIGVVPDQSGRYDVEISIDNRRHLLLPGMTGRTRFEAEEADSSLVIPRKCIVGSMREASVFVLSGDSVERRRVLVEPLDENEVLVRTGILPEDNVALSGQINLINGSKVSILK